MHEYLTSLFNIYESRPLLKHDHCCEGNLPSEHGQYNQVTSLWHIVCGLVHSTLDANRWQLHAVKPHANAFKKASNPKISGNKVRDTSRSKRSTVLLATF